MRKFEFNLRSSLLGTFGLLIPTLFYLGSVVRIEDKALSKSGRAYTVVDSANTTDWTNPKLDTLVTIPISASERFHGDVTYLIKTGAIKIAPRPK